MRVDFYHGGFDSERPDPDADPVAAVDRKTLLRVLTGPDVESPASEPQGGIIRRCDLSPPRTPTASRQAQESDGDMLRR